MAPHRHIYLNPSRSTRNFIASDLPNSAQLASSGEQVPELPATARIELGLPRSQERVEPLPPPAPFQDKGVMAHNQHHEGGANSSSGGHVTPLGLAKPPMTDRNWNNSELKKFSVNQSKSNADIADELKRFQLESQEALDAQDGLIIAQHNGQ